MSSETAHFLIFGNDIEDFPGRGIIEAIGEGIPVEKNDVAILCHLCSVDKRDNCLILTHGRPESHDEAVRALKEEIRTFEAEGIEIQLVHSRKIDGFLILKGDVSADITDSDPIYEGKPVIEVMPTLRKTSTRASENTAAVLNRYLIWSHQRLSAHPTNMDRIAGGLLPMNALVTQRAGKKRELASFTKKWGLRGLSISSGPIYWGLCSELGIDTVKVRDTGDVEEDLRYRLRVARDAKDYDFIHVHTKMPDEAGHTKNPWYKKEVIEAIDRAMSVAISEIIPDNEVLLVVTADHSTASSGIMIHTGETVPLTMVGKYVRRDKVGEFNEVSCASGALGIVKGKELMYLILNFVDRIKMYGLMDTPLDQPYYPGNYKPLTL